MDIIIYTKSNCSYCDRAKNLLNSLDFKFKEIFVNKPEDAQKLFEETGIMTFPQILIDDNMIGGYDDLAALHHQGKLGKQKIM